MNRVFFILVLFLFSCKNESETFDLSKSNISYSERDEETGWTRVLLIKSNKWGFMDKDNKVTIPFEYDFVNPFEHGLAYAKNNGKEFFINTKNEIVINGSYQKVELFSNNLAAVQQSNKWGYINRKGELVIPVQFDKAGYFELNGLAEVSKNGKFGFIDKSGREIIPLNYNKVRSEQLDEHVIAQQNNEWAFFDKSGKQLTDFIFQDVIRAYKNEKSTFFKNGSALVIKDDKYEFLNDDLKPAFSNNKFDSASVFDTYQNAIVKRGDRYGIIKPNGEEIVPLKFDFIGYYDTNHLSSEYYNARKGNVFSIFNKDLKLIAESLEPVYNNFRVHNKTIEFKNLKGKYGVIDWEGNEVIPFVYDKKPNFEGEDYAIAIKNKLTGIINKKNEILVPFEKQSIVEMFDKWDDKPKNSPNYFIVNNGKESKVVDIHNSKILSGYESIQPIHYNHFKLIVKKNGKFGIVDLQNKILLPIIYTDISNWVEYGPRKSHLITINKKTGLIEEETFKLTVEPIYERFRYRSGYRYGLIFVRKNGKEGILLEDGKVICDFKFDEISPHKSFGFGDHNEIFAKKKNQYFQIDEKGNVLKSGITEKYYKEKTQSF